MTCFSCRLLWVIYMGHFCSLGWYFNCFNVENETLEWICLSWGLYQHVYACGHSENSLICNRNMRCKKHPGWNFWLCACSTSCQSSEDLEGCSWHGWVMDHSRRSGTVVCQDRFTRNPGTVKMQCSHKALQQETRKLVACEPQTKLCYLLFIGMITLYIFLPLCSEYMSLACKVYCVNLGHGNTPRKALIM